jgi:hypothetical protein
MKRVSLLAVFALAIGFTLAGSASTARAQAFTGKWVHQGPKGTSFIEFMPGEKRILGPTKGAFHHMILLDDGRLIQGDGHYVFRSIGPKRGWLTLYFADGHVTHEHELTSETMLNIRHHGITQTYIRRVETPPPTITVTTATVK